MRQILSIFVLLAIPVLTFTYPVFGTKRYHRSISPSIGQNPIYKQIPQYYENNYDSSYVQPGFSDEINNNNYYQYPSRHEQQYQRSYGMPTYRGEYKPTPYYYAHGPTYSYYDDREPTNPLDDLHEEMLQEDERERQKDMLPVGQENWYENAGRPDSLANANAAFLRNLIQYNKEIDEGLTSNQEYDEYSDLSQQDNYEQLPSGNNYNFENYEKNYNNDKVNEIEDEDVRELKSLVSKNVPSYNQQEWQQDKPSTSSSQYEPEPEYEDESWINWNKKRSSPPIKEFTDRKPSHFLEVLTTVSPNVEENKLRGQKEVVQPRPATPVRHPFTEPIMKLLQNSDDKIAKSNKVPTVTVYDTIKQLLAMKQKLEKVSFYIFYYTKKKKSCIKVKCLVQSPYSFIYI